MEKFNHIHCSLPLHLLTDSIPVPAIGVSVRNCQHERDVISGIGRLCEVYFQDQFCVSVVIYFLDSLVGSHALPVVDRL